MKTLIIGLGNPGSKYLHNRHNIGFLFLDYMANKYDFSNFKNKSSLRSELIEGIIEEKQVILIKPQTYMNLSGEAVNLLKNYYDTDNIIILFDEIDLTFGDIKYKENGSGGTHNGMKNIVQINGNQIKRIKLGIENRNQEHKADLHKYVLSDFNKEEKEELNNIFNKAEKKLIQTLISS